jgi:two-component system, NarL family, nitrate/nitrite response regulator NarL
MGSLVLGGDHLVFLDALSTVLGQHRHQVGAVVSSSASLAESVRQQQPDACVISLDATGRENADLVQCLHTSALSRLGMTKDNYVSRAHEAGVHNNRPTASGPVQLLTGRHGHG